MYDVVSNPEHYCNNRCGFEPIEITEHMSLCLGSAFAYVFRSKKKGSYIQDLQKAKWYLLREVIILQDQRGVPQGNDYARQKIRSIYLRAYFDQTSPEQVLCEQMILFHLSCGTTSDLYKMCDKLDELVALAKKAEADKPPVPPVKPTEIDEFQRIIALEKSKNISSVGASLGRSAVRLSAAGGLAALIAMDSFEKDVTALEDNDKELYGRALADILTEILVGCAILETDLKIVLNTAYESHLYQKRPSPNPERLTYEA